MGKRGNKQGNKQEEENNHCDLMEPALLMEPFFEPIIKVYEDLFDELHGTTVTATASFGVKLCYEYESGLCFGGGFGFAVNGQRQGFLYRESVLDAVDNIGKVQMDLIPNGRGKREPASTEQPIGSTQSTQQSPTQSTETTHSTQQSSMPSEPHSTEQTHSTMQSQPAEPSQPSEPHSTHSASEPHSTQHQEPEPSMHSTLPPPAHSTESTRSTQQSSMPSEPHSTEPMPTIKPSEPHPTHNTDPAQSTQSTQTTHSTMQSSEPQSTHYSEPPKSTNQPQQPEPSMYPTLGNEPSEPRVFSTFYIEFGLFDDIDAIHSMELEREMNEKLEGIWVTDPSIVYDKGANAVGVTFNAEVSIDGRLSPGSAMGAVILDKVAELISDDSHSGNGGGEENVMASKLNLMINRKKALEMNEYVPMMIVCAAIGVTVVFAAKLYSRQFGRKGYEPLLG